MGAGERVDFTKMKDPIIGFVLDVKGLMADISLKGPSSPRSIPNSSRRPNILDKKRLESGKTEVLIH
jgi:hypothetical protein